MDAGGLGGRHAQWLWLCDCGTHGNIFVKHAVVIGAVGLPRALSHDSAAAIRLGSLVG